MAGVKAKTASYDNKDQVNGDTYGLVFDGVTTGPESVTNESGAVLSAARIDVPGGGVGVTLDLGGTVTNKAQAQIIGASFGVEIFGGPGHVINAGTITGRTKSAVEFGTKGGSVVNAKTGVIQGGPKGVGFTVGIFGGAGKVVNDGVINTVQADAAIGLQVGGTVSNAGVIRNRGGGEFSDGVHIVAVATGSSVDNEAGGAFNCDGTDIEFVVGKGIVDNAGALTSWKGGGVSLEFGGEATNEAGGRISSYLTAVSADAGGLTVTNDGSIVSSKGAGVQGGIGADTITNGGSIRGVVGVALPFDGVLTNKSGGTITGAQEGVLMVNGGSVVDAGLISGATGSVKFEGAGAHDLTLEQGASLVGAAVGSTQAGATNTLTLLGSGKAYNEFLNFTKMIVKANGTWTLTVDSKIKQSTITTGTLQIIRSTLTTQATEAKAATLAVEWRSWLILEHHSTLSGSVTGRGTVGIAENADVSVFGKVGAEDTFDYMGSGDLHLNDLSVGGRQLFQGKIEGFGVGDILDAGAPFGGNGLTSLHFTANAGGGTLSLTHGAFHASLTLLGSYVGSDFHIAGDGHGGSLITYK